METDERRTFAVGFTFASRALIEVKTGTRAGRPATFIAQQHGHRPYGFITHRTMVYIRNKRTDFSTSFPKLLSLFLGKFVIPKFTQ